MNARMKKAMDKLCREIVFKRDRYRCRRVGHGCVGRASPIISGNQITSFQHELQWAHVYTRGKMVLRWDLDNSMALCAGCHIWQTHNPIDGAAFFREILGESVMQRLGLVYHTPRRPNYDLIRLALIQDAYKYGIPVPDVLENVRGGIRLPKAPRQRAGRA